jgi:hypothetical protein
MNRKWATVETAIVTVAVSVVALQVVWGFAVRGDHAGGRSDPPSINATGSNPPAVGLWAESLRTMEEALVRGDIAAARKARYHAYLQARDSRSWDGLLAAGYAAARLRSIVPDRPAMEAQAREAFVEALLRARDQDSMDGVLAATEGLRTLGEHRLVAQGVRVAREMVRDEPSAQPPMAASVEQPAANRSLRKLPRQVDTSKVDFAGASGLGRNVSGGTWPRLSWGRSVL